MKLYNTLTRTTDTFEPAGDIVKMYVCGLTPYAPQHVGHAMRAVIFDVLRRYLEFSGYVINHVENFTDIDDKMIQHASRAGISTQELAERNIQMYLEDIDALNVLRAHAYPRATEEIPRIQEMITILMKKGVAYVVDGNVYFRVRQNRNYGKLSRRSLDSMRAGARVEIDENKEDVMDFALWKSQKPGEPAWGSPWGSGRPGWHIECSAMSMSYLGTTIDIHGGGQDLVFPHHENEIAQTESYSDGQPMARFWVHNGLLKIGENKMSKSLGNLVTMSEPLRKFSPDALRLFFLSSHYRSPLNYSDKIVATQERAAERLRNAINLDRVASKTPLLKIDSYRTQFIAAMDDDLNTPRALAVLFDLAHKINRDHEDGLDVTIYQKALRELAGVLGLTLEDSKGMNRDEFSPLFHLLLDTDAELRSTGQEHLANLVKARLSNHGIVLDELDHRNAESAQGMKTIGKEEVSVIMELLIETRSELRATRQYDLGDWIRLRLSELGYILKDTSNDTKWIRRTT